MPKIASSISKDASALVNKEANYQLNEIPKTLVGINNPVNVVSSNLSPNSLQNVLAPSLGTNVNNNVSNLITNKVDELLRLNLNGGGNNVAFNLIKTSINSLLNKNVNNVVDLALGNFTTGVFNNTTTIPPIVNNIDNFFSSGDAEVAIEQYTDVYNSIAAPLS